MEKIFLKATDNYDLELHLFEVANPKGYIQVLHGMEEHQERYEPFVKVLNENGYTVLTSNMRGHGENAPLLGYFSDKNGYKLLLEDQKLITKYYKERFNICKIIIFAHSMGTIVTRNLLQTESSDYDKVILSGFPNPNGAVNIAIALSRLMITFKGPKHFSKALENLAIGSFNKKIKNPKTDLDWLSYKEENVEKYISDQYCGHGFKLSALNDLFHLLKNMAKPNLYKNINNIPLLLVSGVDDPCTGGKKGRLKSINILNKAGFKNITEIHYEKMRHEILNEKDHCTVENDIINFLNN